MWDWDIITGEIYVGDSIQELFGYRIQNNKVDFTDFERCLLPAEKDGVEEKLFETLASSQKNWKDTFLFKRSNGSMASTTSRASIVRDEAGKAIRLIGATHDLTRQMELQGKLKNEVSKRGKLLTEYQENFKLIFNSSSDVLYDVDLITNRVLLSNSYEHIFGYKLVNNLLPVDEWFSHIHPDDKEGLVQDYHQMLSSGTKEWKYSFRFLKADTSVANVLTRCIVLRDATGKAYRRIGYMQDMSRQRVLEQSLEQEITLKEKQIVSAAEKAKEAERLLLGEELHDNVNQLLCTSKLYLDMAKLGGDNIESFLSRSSEYTTLAMEEIRKLTQELTSSAGMDFKLSEAIIKVSRDIMEAYPIKINASLETFMEDSVNEKMKLYIFRIVQEQLNNIIKHAKASKVDIKLLPCLTHINLSISDDGVGFDPEMNGKGIGVKNIKRRVEHYQGTAAFISQPGKGCVLLVTFPVTKPISYPNNVLATDRSNVLVEKITNVIVEIIHHPERQLKTNFSEYLSKKTGYDYTYLANVFSQVKGTTIEKFIISHRIEKVKEMILTDDANLTKIALRLHYSSVAHLSHQFKKVTGFTPSKFKQLSQGTAHL
jgi:signal transduction histidine kinase/AraC-like DNA-binding protein